MSGQLPWPPRQEGGAVRRNLLTCVLVVGAGSAAFHSTAWCNAIGAGLTVFLAITRAPDDGK